MSIFSSYYLKDLTRLHGAMNQGGYQAVAKTYNEHVYFQGMYLALKCLSSIDYTIVDTLIATAKSDRRCYLTLANTINTIIKTSSDNSWSDDMINLFFDRLVGVCGLVDAFHFINKEPWVYGNDIFGISKVLTDEDFIGMSRLFEYITTEFDDNFDEFIEASQDIPHMGTVNKGKLICAYMEHEYNALLEGVYEDFNYDAIIEILDTVTSYCKSYDSYFDEDDRAKISIGMSRIATDAGISDFASIYNFKIFSDKLTASSYDIDLGDNKVIIEDVDRSEIIVEIPNDNTEFVEVTLSNDEVIMYPVEGLRKIKENYNSINNKLTPIYIVDGVHTGVNNMLSVSSKAFETLIRTYGEMDLESFMDTCATISSSGLSIIDKLAILDVYFDREKHMFNDRRIFDIDNCEDVKYYNLLRPLITFYTERDEYTVINSLNESDEYQEMETVEIKSEEDLFGFV